MGTRSRLTKTLLHPATLLAVLALFIATSGAAYAIVITGSQIKDGSVTGADIRNGSLTGADVRNGSLTGTDVKDGSLTAADLALSARGVRAIGAVGKSFSDNTCVVAAGRGIASCTRNAVGDYTLTLSPGVSLSGSYPICSIGNNGGTSSAQTSCYVGVVSSNQVEVNVQSDPGGSGAIAPNEMSPTVPVVVVIP